MDYRNADESIAETCGNGTCLRPIPVAERPGRRAGGAGRDPGRAQERLSCPTAGSGSRWVSQHEDLHVCIRTADGAQFSALTADVGNPHAVTFTDDLERLQLHAPPSWTPLGAYPAGTNVEFVRMLGPRHIAMRVFERGVGETRSCGTGTVAAAAATRQPADDDTPLPVNYVVDIPGGRVEVELTETQTFLTGPAVLVAYGEVAIPEEG
jgi:diaminopimelate epimerase